MSKLFDKRITIVIEEKIWNRLKEIARERKLSGSDLVREAIYKFISQ